ncbi:MAG TPA: histidine kinase, partial [Ferruginibacter sp.]|nr:histidine kinase [Ferruginibacter sp.]
IGTYHSKGLYTMNHHTGEIINYPLINQKVFNENINQLLLDREKKLWVCFTRGVRLFDIRTKQYRLISSSVKNAHFLNSGVYAAMEDDDGSIWFASREYGLLRYDKILKEILVFLPPNSFLKSDFIVSIFKDSKRNIWIGYHGQSGIACIGSDRKNIKYYNSRNYNIPIADVVSICESKEGKILFSLHIYGLGEISDPMSGHDSFRLYNYNNGLPGNKVISIVSDKYNDLWITTNDGLSACHTATMNFKNFSTADGLTDSYSEGALYCDKKGLIYIGSSNGFQYFNPDLFSSNMEIPPVILHSFKINGKEYNGNINTANKIYLEHDEANFSFEYAALNFTNNERIKYAFRLKGIESKWRLPDKQRIAAYSIAHGGSYTLQIKASNGFGQWNGKLFELHIEVQPPYWERWWFIGLSVLTVTLSGYWFMRRRIKNIRETEERKTHLHKIQAEAEMKALRAQMNPHFIFNCMNTIDAYIHKNNTQAASDFLNKFSQLIRQVLENSQYAVISIKKDMEALELYIELEEQRNDFRFTHELHVPEGLTKKGYKIPPLLIQPYVENAILHGLRHKSNGRGFLAVSFEENDSQLICIIDDNGVGRTASASLNSERRHHHSLGLKMSGERIESLNYSHKSLSSVEIIDKPDGTGTIVKLILPKIDEPAKLYTI